MHIDRCWPSGMWVAAMWTAAMLCAGATARAETGTVTVPDTKVFPESLTATSDGALIFSSLPGGGLWRADPGASQAAPWIRGGTDGMGSLLGVLADERSGTLWVCAPNMSALGLTVPGQEKAGALHALDLKSGAPKAHYPLPGERSLCNDIAVGADGTAYVTDSLAGHILRLKPGAAALEIWAQDARWNGKGAQLDGIAILGDGSVYTNIFEGDGLYRVAVNPDGSAGTITKLATSHRLYHADGLRAFGNDRLLMVEGETVGTLDLITPDGDSARVETVKGGFEGPVSLVQVGNVVYVLDMPLKYLLDEKMKGQTAPPGRAVPVAVPR